MSDKLKRVLFFSNIQVLEADLAELRSKDFDLVFSKGKARLIDEILSDRPFAVVLDAKYCKERSAPVDFLLPKIHKSLNGTPVFLIKASGVERLEILKNDLAYAVLQDESGLAGLWAALLRYGQMVKSAGSSNRIRHGVSVPCLVKKLGTSGLIHGEICDLSPKGMKVLVDRQSLDWTPGDEVRFSFSRIGHKGAHLDGYGQLRWSVTDEVQPGIKVTRMGLEFSQLPAPTLQEFMEMMNTARSEAG